MTKSDNIEVYKQKIAISCENVFTAAQNAIIEHPELDTVIIMEHAPRHDISTVDPTGIKAKLAIFANSTFTQLWHSSHMKDKIVVGRHNLKCKDDMINAWYKDDWSGRFDGVHMYGSHGRNAYTKSVLQIIKYVLCSQQQNISSSSSSHSGCPQTLFQKAQRQKTSGHKSNRNIYTVPVSNQFDVLGN